MTGSVSSHTWIVAAVYLGVGVIGGLSLRGILSRLHRRARQTRWRGGDVLVAFLRLAAPQWADQRQPAFKRAASRLPSARIEGVRWYWPAGESPASRRHEPDDTVRLLAPFDPIVWDRRRFERLWGWAYRFEAYVPAPKRVRGYYALPLLWRDQIIGWANAAAQGNQLVVRTGYVSGKAPRDTPYLTALRDEAKRMALFLGLSDFVVG